MENFGASDKLRAFLLASLRELYAALVFNLKFKILLIHSRRVPLTNPAGAIPLALLHLRKVTKVVSGSSSCALVQFDCVDGRHHLGRRFRL